MILKTKDFSEPCKTILLAVDNNAANLELIVQDNYLYLNVTNREYFASVKYLLEATEDFHAVVDASLFLNLISGITTEEFELKITENFIAVKAGKSSYKLPMIYENETLLSLPKITIENTTVEMKISNDILMSILNINSKELLKVKNIDVNELQKLYFIDETGCFTFTSGACLNSFTLEKPVKLLLNDRLVKLFKLFKTDIDFALGYDALPSGQIQTKITLKNDSVSLSAIITNDDILLSKIQGPCLATKNFINENYAIKIVLSVKELTNAISRLLQFTKNSITKANMLSVPATIMINSTECTITDELKNTEAVTVENGSYVGEEYKMCVNLADLKLVLDSCKEEHITLNCGNHRSIVINRANVNNLIPEIKN